MNDLRPTQPWLDEPEYLDFADEATGYPCAMRRSPFYAWCGYVGVPDTHPWHGKSFQDRVPLALGDMARPANAEKLGVINLVLEAMQHSQNPDTVSICSLVNCHGGLTYAGDTQNFPRPCVGASWWFGFDCGHDGDLSPTLVEPPRGLFPALDVLLDRVAEMKKEREWRDGPDVYRDVTYVKAALVQMCADIKKGETR